jgi:hypothetical protein
MSGATLPANTAAKQTALDKAIAAVKGHCGRGFEASAEGVTRTFAGNGEPVLDIDDLLAVTSITYNGSAVTATEYNLLSGDNKAPWVYLERATNATLQTSGGEVAVTKTGVWVVGYDVTIVGQWGYAATVPEEVVEACCELAALRLLGGDGWNALGVKSTAVLSVSVTYDPALVAAKRAEAFGRLRGYRRIEPEPNL